MHTQTNLPSKNICKFFIKYIRVVRKILPTTFSSVARIRSVKRNFRNTKRSFFHRNGFPQTSNGIFPHRKLFCVGKFRLCNFIETQEKCENCECFTYKKRNCSYKKPPHFGFRLILFTVYSQFVLYFL